MYKEFIRRENEEDDLLFPIHLIAARWHLIALNLLITASHVADAF